MRDEFNQTDICGSFAHYGRNVIVNYFPGHQSDLADWSMQRVANEVENMFDASVAEKFLQNVKLSFFMKLNLQYSGMFLSAKTFLTINMC